MTKIYINYRTINNNVVSSIESSIEKLNSIIYNTGDLTIPSDFSFATYLKNLPDDISIIRSNLIEKKKLIKLNSDSYKNIENINLNKFSSIKIFPISLRKK